MLRRRRQRWRRSSRANLRRCSFRVRKPSTSIGAARRIVEGKLDLDALRTMSATRAERTLLAIRGLGPWSVNYVMMRALGFPGLRAARRHRRDERTSSHCSNSRSDPTSTPRAG